MKLMTSTKNQLKGGKKKMDNRDLSPDDLEILEFAIKAGYMQISIEGNRNIAHLYTNTIVVDEFGNIRCDREGNPKVIINERFIQTRGFQSLEKFKEYNVKGLLTNEK